MTGTGWLEWPLLLHVGRELGRDAASEANGHGEFWSSGRPGGQQVLFMAISDDSGRMLGLSSIALVYPEERKLYWWVSMPSHGLSTLLVFFHALLIRLK